MKTRIFFVISVGMIVLILSCNHEENRYVDVNTGTAVALKKDSVTGQMVNAETGKPVKIYVDTRTHDTIYGKTGKVVNGHVIKSTDGVYVYEDDEDRKGREGVEIKHDGEDYKVKGDDYKKKVDDEEVKIKTDDKVIKIDKETGERKEKKRLLKKIL